MNKPGQLSKSPSFKKTQNWKFKRVSNDENLHSEIKFWSQDMTVFSNIQRFDPVTMNDPVTFISPAL